jgi:cytochrome c5
MSEEHSSPIKNWKQLVVVVVLAFVVPITVISMLASLVTRTHESAAEGDNAVLARIQPVGNVTLAQAAGPRGQLTGEQVYQQVCKTCHDAGLAGAPKLGDKGAWAKVIAQGEKTTFEHALRGIRAMPAKGGNPDLDDVEVQRAAVYMVNAAGADWKAPAAPAPSAPAVVAQTATAGGERTGEQVVVATCGKCHVTGQFGAPKIGDRKAWIQREKQGLNVIYASALKGHAGMPARGGMAELSDVEVKRAVEYMMNSGAATPVAGAVAAAAPAPAPVAAAKADGKKVYDTACVACHGAGIAGAPKFADKGAWAPRIAQGANVLNDHAIKGFQGKAGMMPAKGGNASLSDDDVKAAVDYMAAAAK